MLCTVQMLSKYMQIFVKGKKIERKERRETKKKYPLQYCCYSPTEAYLSQMLLFQIAVFYFPESLQTLKENYL